ncbi:MAG: acyltransferase family protein [Xanthobacteraceae bacterium]
MLHYTTADLSVMLPSPSLKHATSAEHCARDNGTVLTIQYLRALAAGLVVLQHALAPASAHAARPLFGDLGVALFFVISGYIMWRTTCGGGRGPLAFWAARLVRIVPLYWLFTTLFVLVALLLPGALSSEPGLDPAFILKSYLFVPAVHPHDGHVAPVYTLGWTLNYEMFFYLVFGACLFIAQGTLRLIAVIGVFVLLVAVGSIARPSDAVLATYTNSILLEFLAGVLLAASTPWLMRRGKAAGAALVLLGAAWFAACSLSPIEAIRTFALSGPATILVAGAIMLEPLARHAPSRLGLLLGDASYSVYLTHPFALRLELLATAALGASSWPGLLAYIAFAVPTALVAGVVCYVLVERPLVAGGHHLVPRRSRSQRSAALAAAP